MSWKEKLGCKCPEDQLVLVEYGYDHPERYDGVSEVMCRECGKRVGRWSGKELKGEDYELRFGGV